MGGSSNLSADSRGRIHSRHRCLISKLQPVLLSRNSHLPEYHPEPEPGHRSITFCRIVTGSTSDKTVAFLKGSSLIVPVLFRDNHIFSIYPYLPKAISESLIVSSNAVRERFFSHQRSYLIFGGASCHRVEDVSHHTPVRQFSR
jgi:hypothetical protein